MQTIKNYTHITQDFCLYLKLKKIKNYRKPHIEQNDHNLHYNKGKFSAFFFFKNLQLWEMSKQVTTNYKFISLVLKDFL